MSVWWGKGVNGAGCGERQERGQQDRERAARDEKVVFMAYFYVCLWYGNSGARSGVKSEAKTRMGRG